MMDNLVSKRIHRVKPELTQERRAAMHAWYSNTIASMKSEFDSWYPEGNVAVSSVATERRGFVDRIASISNELGYPKWYGFAASAGFSLAGAQAATPFALDARLDIADAALWQKIIKSLGNIDEWYPDGPVIDYKKAHKKSCENLNVLAKKFGFESWHELLTACGYEVANTYTGKGGRPSTIDYDAIIDSLKEQYSSSPATSIYQLRADNPEIPWKSLSNNSKREFGDTLASYLKELGILQDKAKSSLNEDELWQTVNRLIDKYAPLADKPKSLAELYYLEPEAAACMHAFGSKAADVLGASPSVYFKSHGVLPASKTKKKKLTDEECEQLIAALLEENRHLNAVRDMASLKKSSQLYADNSTMLNAWIKAAHNITPLQFFTERGVVSKAARQNSIPRPEREEVERFEQEHTLTRPNDLLALADDGEIIQGSISLDENADENSPSLFGMLHPGDVVSIELNDTGSAIARFCKHTLGYLCAASISGIQLKRILAYPMDYGLVNNRVYAQVLTTAGRSQSNTAELDVWFVIDSSKKNVKNGILLSRDGKTALGLAASKKSITVPKGVETIAPHAFEYQPITKVTLPETLRVIGRSAFRLCGVQTYHLPATIEQVEPGAFSFCSPKNLTSEWTHRAKAGGPVYIEVEPGGAYSASEGTLCRREGDEVTLISLFYDKSAKRLKGYDDGLLVTLVVPNHVTRIASHCVSAFERLFEYTEYDLKLPDSVTTIDEDAFVTEDDSGHTHMPLHSVNIPAGLINVHHSFWENAVEDIPFAYDQDWNPLADLEITTRVKISKGNPRYSLRRGILHDAFLANKEKTLQKAGNAPVYERLSEPDAKAHFATLVHDQFHPAHPLAIQIPVQIEPPSDSELLEESLRAWPILQAGDILTVLPAEDGKSLIAHVFGHMIGTVSCTAEGNPFAAHPQYAPSLEDAAQAMGFVEIDRNEYVNDLTGETINYTFAFLDQEDESARKELSSHLSHHRADQSLFGPSDPELGMRAQYLSFDEENDAAFEAVPSLAQVVHEYLQLGGVGEPIVIVNNVAKNDALPCTCAASGTLHLLYSIQE